MTSERYDGRIEWISLIVMMYVSLCSRPYVLNILCSYLLIFPHIPMFVRETGI